METKMNFPENLQFLRKKHDLTQEQLAEKLEISRQAVSKWEAGLSYPEMDKLLAMCQLFSCQLNVLVQGNVREDLLEDTAKYDSFYNRCSIAIAAGVGLILLALSGMLWMEPIGMENQGVFLFMLFVAIAVFVFVITGIKMEFFCKNHPQITDFYTKEQKNAFQQRFAIAIASGVALILLGAAFMTVSEFTHMNDGRSAAIFMLLVTVAVTIFVYFGMQKEKYDILQYNSKNGKADVNFTKKGQSLADKSSGVIMLSATAIFLLLGFVWNLWHPGWAVFPIGAILCAITSIIFND